MSDALAERDVIDAQIVSDSMKARGRQPSPEMQRHHWLATDAVDAVAWGDALADAGCWASGEVCIEADSAKFVHRSARAMAR